MTRVTRATTVVLLLSGLASVTATAGTRRHHRPASHPPVPVDRPGAARPFMFYPEEIEGGVSGNLPFNNQIRKHTDPLNANGGR